MNIAIKTILYVNTKFQVYQLERYVNELKIEFIGKCIVYYENLSQVDVEFLIDQGVEVERLIEVPTLQMRARHFFLNPISNLKKILSISNHYLTLVEGINFERSPVFVLFNDKSLFAQFLTDFLNRLSSDSSFEKVCIEEGIGYYRGEKANFFRKKLYPIISSLVLGFPVQYLRVMGISPFVNRVYVRSPKHLLVRKNSIRYLPLKNSADVNPDKERVQISGSRKVLFLSSTLSEDKIIDSDSEIKIFTSIVDFLTNNGFEIHLKVHPREDKSKYLPFSNKVNLVSNTIAQDISLESFELILSYSSSFLFEIIVEERFNLNNIINISFPKFKLGSVKVFDSVYHIRYSGDKSLRRSLDSFLRK